MVLRTDPHYAHPSQFYKPKTRILTSLTRQSQIQEIVNRYGNEFSRGYIIRQIHTILKRVKKRLIKDGEKWINRYVPKATGQLRESLKSSLRTDTKIYDLTQLKVKLGSHVSYLQYVNPMSRYNLVHPAGHHPNARLVNYYGGKRVVILNDKQATQGFFDKLLRYLRERFQFHLRQGIYWIANRHNISSIPLRQQLNTQDGALGVE